LYSLFGASGLVDSFVSVGGHDYREDIRQGAFRFLNTHLKNDPGKVSDTEIDLVIDGRNAQHPIKPEELRVFPDDENIPNDALNAKIDESFVPIGEPALPKSREGFASWKKTLTEKLREVTFNHFPGQVPAATLVRDEGEQVSWIKTEANIQVRLRKLAGNLENTKTIVLAVADEDIGQATINFGDKETDAIFVVEPRGIGATKWTTKNPPNYVERSHYLLGRTVDSGRVWDVIAAARYLKDKQPKAKIKLAGEGRAGVLAVFAAIFEEEVGGVILGTIPESLMDSNAPALLNALRVCDLPTAVGLLADREVQSPQTGRFFQLQGK